MLVLRLVCLTVVNIAWILQTKTSSFTQNRENYAGINPLVIHQRIFQIVILARSLSLYAVCSASAMCEEKKHFRGSYYYMKRKDRVTQIVKLVINYENDSNMFHDNSPLM